MKETRTEAAEEMDRRCRKEYGEEMEMKTGG